MYVNSWRFVVNTLIQMLQLASLFRAESAVFFSPLLTWFWVKINNAQCLFTRGMLLKINGRSNYNNSGHFRDWRNISHYWSSVATRSFVIPPVSSNATFSTRKCISGCWEALWRTLIRMGALASQVIFWQCWEYTINNLNLSTVYW